MLTMRASAGPIARVGPNHLVTDDPDLMKRVLNVRTEYRRSEWYDGMRFNPASNNVLSWRDETEHFNLRSKMSAGVCLIQAHLLPAMLTFCSVVWRPRSREPRGQNRQEHFRLCKAHPYIYRKEEAD